MFYDIYIRLCEENGEKPYSLPIKLGARSNSVVAQWRAGSIPRTEMLNKIADYFNVSVGYLLGYEDEKKEVLPEDRTSLRNKINQRMNSMTEEQLESLLKFLDTIPIP